MSIHDFPIPMVRLDGGSSMAWNGFMNLLLVLFLACLAFLLWRQKVLRSYARATKADLASEAEGRQQVEEDLRRTLAMFQLLQDVTSAVGMARSMEGALQSTLDIISGYTGWPVSHAFLAETSADGILRLRPCGIWHLESPREYEAFLRGAEPESIAMGKGLPGKAWSSRRAVWTNFIRDAHAPGICRRALQVGLTTSIAVAIFHDDELIAALEFFSPPIPDPDDTMVNALEGIAKQLGIVTERLQAEEAVEKLNRRLVEMNEEKNQFLGIASHDLKNPLNTIALTAELLMTGELNSEEIVEMGSRISKEAHRTALLIQKLLDVTAIESGRFNLRFGEVSLGELLLQIQGKYQERAARKGQQVVLDLGGGDTPVWADRDYLYEVIDNLMSNALKFMASGPPVRTVTLALSQQDGHGVLEVRDEGPGFTEADKVKIFGRFTKLSARPTGGEGSTGLGLAIVKKLVESMRGQVMLESQLGRGSTFRVSIPLAPDLAPPEV
jgi:signal transduction histidine kinase